MAPGYRAPLLSSQSVPAITAPVALMSPKPSLSLSTMQAVAESLGAAPGKVRVELSSQSPLAWALGASTPSTQSRSVDLTVLFERKPSPSASW